MQRREFYIVISVQAVILFVSVANAFLQRRRESAPGSLFMDYTTSHIFLVVSLGLFCVALFSLSLADRSVVGARWLGASVLVDLIKTTLQGMDGRLSRQWTVLVPNELNIVVFFFMFLGLRWFVRRRPLARWIAPAVAASMLLYWEMVRLRTWSFPTMGAVVLCLCGATVWMMLENREARFRIPARITAVLLSMQIVLVSYRVGLSLTAQHGSRLQTTGWVDPQWMYSMLGIMLVGYCLLLIYVLFTAMEIYSHVARSAGLDALTGSLNRRALMKHVGLELERCERAGRPLSIVAMDLDHFKRVNDTHGHGGGDAALCAFVSLVKERLRSRDIVARMGGEEFVLVLPDLDAMEAAYVAERLRCDVEEMRVEYDGRVISTTVSAGVTEWLEPGDDWAAMVKRADRSLYRAKSEGRNRVMIDERAMRPKTVAFASERETDKAAQAL